MFWELMETRNNSVSQRREDRGRGRGRRRESRKEKGEKEVKKQSSFVSRRWWEFLLKGLLQWQWGGRGKIFQTRWVEDSLDVFECFF